MSQFGQRDIPIIQQPMAPVDVSAAQHIGVLREVFGGLASAVGGAANFRRAQIERDTQREQMAQRLGASRFEVEQAESRLELTNTRLKIAEQSLATDKAMHHFADITQMELHRGAADLSGKTAEEQAKWLAENPQYTREAQSKIAKSVASSLFYEKIAPALMQRLYDERSDTGAAPDSGFMSKAVLDVLGDPAVASLPPDVRAALQEQTTQYGSGILRGIISQEDQMERSAQRSREERVLAENALDYVTAPDAASAGGLLERMLSSVDGGVFTDRREGYDILAANIARSVRNSVENGVLSPTEAIDRAFSTGDQEITKRLERHGLRGELEKAERRRVATVIQSTDAAVKDELDLLTGEANIVALNAYGERLAGIIPPEAKDRLPRYERLIEAAKREVGVVNTQIDAARRFIGGEITERPPITPAAVNAIDADFQRAGMSPIQAASETAARLGAVSEHFTKNLKSWLSPETLDLDSALTAIKAVESQNPMLARRLLENEWGRPGALLAEFTAGLPDDGPEAAFAKAVLQHPLASQALSEAAGVLTGDMSADLTKSERRGDVSPNILMPHLDILRSIGVPAEHVTEEMVRKYEAHFKLHYVKSYAENPVPTFDKNPPPEALARLAYARAEASDALRGMFTNVNGRPMRIDTLSMLPGSSRDPATTKWVGSTLLDFEDAVDADGGGQPLMHLAIPVGGKTYIPAGDEDTGITHLLEIEPGRRRQRILTPDGTDPGLFDQIKRLMDDEITPEQFSRYAPLLWRPGYVEQTVQGYDRRFGASIGRQLYQAALEEWGEELTDENTDEFIAFSDEFIQALGWRGWDSGNAPREDRGGGE